MEAFDKEQSRARRVEIRRILMSKWDPIGVSDVPEAADEYDMYIGAIYGMLDRNATDAEIAEYLLSVETGRMGLVDLEGEPLGDPLLVKQARLNTVAALQQLKSSWQ
jgi:hypothetical protein